MHFSVQLLSLSSASKRLHVILLSVELFSAPRGTSVKDKKLMSSSCSGFLFLILKDFNWCPLWFGANCKQLSLPLDMQVALLSKSFQIHNTGVCKGVFSDFGLFSLAEAEILT